MPEPRRPRIDLVLKAIQDGKYDDQLEEIKKAISYRDDLRKEEVLKKVREVYGEDYVVQKPGSNKPAPLIPGFQYQNPLGTPIKEQNNGQLDFSQFEVKPGDTPEVRDPNSDQQPDDEIISTGAQIGGLPQEKRPDILPGER